MTDAERIKWIIEMTEIFGRTDNELYKRTDKSTQ